MNPRRGWVWVTFGLALALVSCGSFREEVTTPVLPMPVRGDAGGALSVLLKRYVALRSLSQVELNQEIEKARTRFVENPSLENRRRLVSLMALPAAPFPHKTAMLDLLQQDGQLSVPAARNDLYLVPETTVYRAVRQEQRVHDLMAEVSARDREIAQLKRTLKGWKATRDRYRDREASLERQLEHARSWAMTLSRQLDELRKIEKSIEDRRQSTPLQLPKQQDDQAQER